jgi:hypothetical protein
MAIELVTDAGADYNRLMRRTVALMLSLLLASLPLTGANAHAPPAHDHPCEHADVGTMDCCHSGDIRAPQHCDCGTGASCHSGGSTGFWATAAAQTPAALPAHVGVTPERTPPFSSTVLAVPIRPPIAGA